MEAEEFAKLFERFERSAFRVEARDQYDVAEEREELARFLAGKELPPGSPGSRAWLAFITANMSAGRVVERVRIVSEPLTDYTRYEFAAYRRNIGAGEQIRVLPRSVLTDADQAWASEDFWIFDDELVAVLHYDDVGRFVGAEQAAELTPYLEAKRRSLTLAVDFEEFVAEF
jgi:hypothetical protein